MINLLARKIAKYFSDKTIAKVNADPVGIAKQHFRPVVDMLPMYGKIEALFWVGSYEYDLKMIEYFRNQAQISKKTFEANPFNKSTEDERIVDTLLGKGSDGGWFLAFFADASDLRKAFSLLDSFRIRVEDETELLAEPFTKII